LVSTTAAAVLSGWTTLAAGIDDWDVGCDGSSLQELEVSTATQVIVARCRRCTGEWRGAVRSM
jgi:hypothetical protein